jgi:acetoin utilization deacetylase AcuC-like enzyme
MGVTSPGYGKMTRSIMDIAEQCCDGRIAFTLEGGYNLKALTEGLSSVLQALLSDREAREQDELSIDSATAAIMNEVRAVQGEYWSSVRK